MEETRKQKIEQEMSKNCSVVHDHSVSLHKKVIIESHQEIEDFSSPTPVKTKEPSRIKSKEELAELPEKYMILLEFFSRMTSSLRLLALRKRKPTFRSICSQVEILTGRKFLFMHLAQMKYILSEALQIDKILIHDEKTKCMVPDMEISLLFDVIEDHCEESVFVVLSNLFSSRLREHWIAHPTGSDIPEAVLPEPFNLRSSTYEKEPMPEDLSTSFETEILNVSHFAPSFRKHIYRKVDATEMEKTIVPSNLELASSEKPKTLPESSPEAVQCVTTPMKVVSESDSHIVETPVQFTPMRSISPSKTVLTCENESKSNMSQKCKQSNSTAKKSIDFYCIGGEDTTVSHKQVSVSLSALVLLINQIFKSVNFVPITKQELVHKIIMHNCEIDDQSELEIQMDRLEKLVPDWFFKKLAASGDLLYYVKKVSDLNSICERIEVI